MAVMIGVLAAACDAFSAAAVAADAAAPPTSTPADFRNLPPSFCPQPTMPVPVIFIREKLSRSTFVTCFTVPRCSCSHIDSFSPNFCACGSHSSSVLLSFFIRSSTIGKSCTPMMR